MADNIGWRLAPGFTVLLFQLYCKHKEYFQVDKDYVPSIQNLKELQKLVQSKLSKNKNNDTIKFYKNYLNPNVHLNEDKFNYLLPTKMFKNETESIEYFLNLESINANEKDESLDKTKNEANNEKKRKN